MKYLLFASMIFLSCTVEAQDQNSNEASEKVIIDNDKMKVVEFDSMPHGNVCGAGIHHHEPHLTVLLSDAKVQITAENGESQIVEAPSGMSIWSESETHSVINKGDQPTKMLLVYLKE